MAAIGKKGIYFTLITVLILSVMLISFSANTYVSQSQDIPVVSTRVQIADNYVKDINDFYLERALYASSYWALESLSLYQNQTGASFSDRADVNKKFKEVMINGSINGQDIDTITRRKIMNNNTFLHRLGQIENASMAAYSIKTSFDKDAGGMDVSIGQSDITGPWKVSVNITAKYTVDAGLARWNRTARTQTLLEIYDIDDPLYFVDGNKFQRSIRQTPFTSWNVSNLQLFILNGSYRYEANGTSFLDRYYGNVSPSECCGIESALNPNALGTTDTDKSYIDWCFLSSRCPPNVAGQIWNITGITSANPGQNFYAFKLDDYHVVIYNVSQEAYH